MAFDIEKWKQSLKETLPGFRERMKRAGVNSTYAMLSTMALLPVVEASRQGDFAALMAVGGVLGNVGANLVSNVIQKWQDEANTARELEAQIKTDDELRQALDKILAALEAAQLAEKSLSETDRTWFAETLQKELTQLKSSISYTATLAGSGAIAQGNGATAVGAGGVLVNGGIQAHRDVILGDQTNHYHAPDPRELAREEEDKAQCAYLEKLRRHCQVLPLAALGGEEGAEDELSLDNVYIDLDTTIKIKKTDLDELRSGKKHSLPQAVLGKDAPDLLERMGEQKDIAPLPALEAIRATSRAVLLGEPGAGKSTFARKLLGLQAASLLGQCKPLAGFTDDLLPVLVILRELVPLLVDLNLENLPAEARKQKLLEVITQYLALPFINTALESGKVMLVLDGLDEVPQDLRKVIRQVVAALLSEYRVERLLITSRIRSYTGNAVFENLQTFTLRPFDEDKIANFVRAWYATQAEMGRVREKDRDERIKDLVQAATSGDLREIASNPMMLTSMAIIHQKEICLPKERVRLYKLVVDVLLRRWQKHKLGEGQMVPSLPLLAFLKDENRLLAAMERLAYEAHRVGKGEKRTADLPRLAALEILEQKEYLGEIGLAQEFLDYVDQRSGLVKGNGGELDKPTSYSFPHRTFQEYLAGCYLIRDRSAAREYYRHAAEGDFWALSAQLGAEELYYNRRGQPYMRGLAYELLTSARPANATDQRAALWSGMIARIAGLEEIEADLDSPKGGPKYIGQIRPALLQVMQGNLPPIERAEAGRVLAKLGDPRPEVLTCEQMIFCHVPVGDFLMGDMREKTPMPQEYWMGKTPVTNAQFAQFVAARGYQNPDYWADTIKKKYWSKDGFKGRYDDTPRMAPVDHGEPFNLPNHPVVGVTWYEARAFTRWLSSQLSVISKQWSVNRAEQAFRESIQVGKVQLDLPTEEQWEKAARGTDGRKYPWDENADPNRANYDESGIHATSAVGCFPAGESPYGILDASGNVWEWVAEPGLLRGGSFYFDADWARCAYRFRRYPDIRDSNGGFRVVLSPLLLSQP